VVRPHDYHPIRAALSLPWRFFSIGAAWWGGVRPFWARINYSVFLVLAVVALRKLSWSLFSTPRSLLWLWLLSPCVGIVAFDLVLGTYTTAYHRYALAGMPAAFLLAGLVLGSLRYRARAVFIVLIVLLCLVGVRCLYLADCRDYAYRELVRQLGHQVGESDLILVSSIPSGVTGLARYLEREHASETGVGFASCVGRPEGRRVPERLEAFAAGRKRIILVTMYEIGKPAPEQSWLEENGTLVEMKQIRGAVLRYFIPRDSTAFFAPSALKTK
jgi:hypothetical protein